MMPIVLLCSAGHTAAFGIETHRQLNSRAAQASNLDSDLKDRLGLKGGLLEEVDGKNVQHWIREGGALEDMFLGSGLLGAFPRSRHHFHNPLLPWDRAGLNTTSPCPPFALRGEASVRWAQNPAQGISGQAAWQDARQAFYRALTATSKADRDRAWATTFLILGQQMHLIADLAVPAHTRNDAHCPRPEGFESWAARNRERIGAVLAGPAIKPPPAIFTLGVPIPDPIATVPVSRLWDTDRYDGTNPDITLSPTIGLAEYSNANFFSDDTVFSAEFPFPGRGSVDLNFRIEAAPDTGGQMRRYFSKVRDGEPIARLAVPSALYDALPAALKDRKVGLDANVFEDYATKLFPRAVGYSAALLDYFFRGRLSVSDVSFDHDQAELTVVNRTDEELEGVFELWGVYDKDSAQERRAPVVALEAGAVTTMQASGWRSFRLQVPEGIEPTARYMLVFRGRIGSEPDAVAAADFFVPYVIVAQALSTATIIKTGCREGTRVNPPPGDRRGTWFMDTSFVFCDWTPIAHQLGGRILTNSREPIIRRVNGLIFAKSGRKTITLFDRQGTEPDPASFGIDDPLLQGPVSVEVDVELTNGRFVSTRLVTISSGDSNHFKAITADFADGAYTVSADRNVGLSIDTFEDPRPDMRRPGFRTATISGHANPTDTRRPEQGGVYVDFRNYDETVVDVFQRFPGAEPSPSRTDAGYLAAREIFDGIKPMEDPQTGKGPRIIWEAVVERAYPAGEVEFLRAFMTPTPPPVSITATGQQ